MRVLPPSLSLLAALLLSACATPASEADAGAAAGPETPVTTPASPAPEAPAMTCSADKVQWTLGQVADEALVAKARIQSGAERMRVIKPGMAVTMDYREDRLNLDVDADNKVTRAHCG
ncbi:I78 family peptidase inhibitor [Arenimonas terrae]|jgi:hypothetical protein|uniref:Peptidase inhibitor I78 family protein n=1 Tax=Arenimonas terrae TaxID=2546226 RepID=A0A5C4RN40_9GAMM|nr:I78 family peptidase inhibitor [Arenimonas terrae]TNJ32686.1 hypothetical protein E1B00_14905 [Arenimonas terrae]